MISVQEAQHKMMANPIDLGTTTVSIDLAMGRILQEDLFADSDLPPFHRVMMDGIAINYQDLHQFKAFKIIGTQKAGEDRKFAPHAGEAIEIMTGAILPESFDTVVPYENIDLSGNMARINVAPTKAGQHVHRKGTDFLKNDILAKFPCEIGTAEIGVAASVGKSMLRVKALPKILIIATGDELVDIPEQPNAFQIRKSNDLVIQNVITKYCECIEKIHIKDNLIDLEKNLLSRLEQFDVFIFIGGVSKGKFDFVAHVAQVLNFQTIFHGIAQKPGKPMLLARNKNKFLIGLPGNPVSAMVCAYKYVLPWLSESLGYERFPLPVVTSIEMTTNSKLSLFIPVSIKSEDGQWIAEPILNNGSGDFASLVSAHGWIEIPAGTEAIKKGSKVNFISLKP